MTNGDKLRHMTNEELASKLCRINGKQCPPDVWCRHDIMTCEMCWQIWLEKEIESKEVTTFHIPPEIMKALESREPVYIEINNNVFPIISVSIRTEDQVDYDPIHTLSIDFSGRGRKVEE